MLEIKKINIQNSRVVFQDFFIILGLLSFFFLWDIKFNIYKDLTFSLRELFYLLFFLLLINYKKFFQFKLIKYLFFFTTFLFYNFYLFGFNIDLLNINYNIVSIFFAFAIFLICLYFKDELISKINITFIIFICIFSLSLFFSEIDYLNLNERSRVCGIVNFRFLENFFFLEPSHLGMVIIPFYYFVFKENKIKFFLKIILLLILIFIFIFFYSLTLLFAVIICFFLMILIDYRFFLKNKTFFVFQCSILLVPFFFNSCFYKLSHSVDKINYIKENLNTNTNVLSNIEINFFDLNTGKIKESNINYNIDQLTLKINSTNLKLNSRYCDKQENTNICKDLYKEYIKLNDLRKKLYKKKLFYSLDKFSPKEINYLIRKNIENLPIENNLNINDHSSAVLLNALNVAFLSIKEKPFGWGFNNYQMAFNKYMLNEIIPPFPEIYYLNYNDGSNNFIKLFVEFGILSFLIFFNLLYFLFNKKIPVSQRILFGGIIITQMVRAAGYFNGGFVLCIIFTFILNYQSFNNLVYEKIKK